MDGRLVHNDTKRFEPLSFAHEAGTDLIKGILIRNVVEGGKVVRQGCDLLGHFSACLLGHAQAFHHGLGIRQETFDLLLGSFGGATEIVDPGLGACSLAAKDRFKLGLGLFSIGSGIDGGSCKILDPAYCLLEYGQARYGFDQG